MKCLEGGLSGAVVAKPNRGPVPHLRHVALVDVEDGDLLRPLVHDRERSRLAHIGPSVDASAHPVERVGDHDDSTVVEVPDVELPGRDEAVGLLDLGEVLRPIVSPGPDGQVLRPDDADQFLVGVLALVDRFA